MEKAGIDWTFQSPRTAHFGGAHESSVKSTKHALYSPVRRSDGASPRNQRVLNLFWNIWNIPAKNYGTMSTGIQLGRRASLGGGISRIDTGTTSPVHSYPCPVSIVKRKVIQNQVK
jgi:hypothetical protein